MSPIEFGEMIDEACEKIRLARGLMASKKARKAIAKAWKAVDEVEEECQSFNQEYPTEQLHMPAGFECLVEMLVELEEMTETYETYSVTSTVHIHAFNQRVK